MEDSKVSKVNYHDIPVKAIYVGVDGLPYKIWENGKIIDEEMFKKVIKVVEANG